VAIQKVPCASPVTDSDSGLTYTATDAGYLEKAMMYLRPNNPVAPKQEFLGFNVIYEWYDFGNLTFGAESGLHYICWGQTIDMLNVPLGELYVHGVNHRNNVCVMGFICTITITGTDMHRRNAIRILKPGYECWDEQPDLVSNYEIMSITNPRANSDGVAFGADPNARIYTMGFIERGAVSTTGYTICYTKNQYNTIDYPFSVNIGTLSLSGPSLSENECHLGEDCTVFVQGVNLHPNNIGRISLNEQCPVASNYLIVPYSDWTAIENRDWYLNNPYSVANPNKPEETALYS
jgi:hypothetical protein